MGRLLLCSPAPRASTVPTYCTTVSASNPNSHIPSSLKSGIALPQFWPLSITRWRHFPTAVFWDGCSLRFFYHLVKCLFSNIILPGVKQELNTSSIKCQPPGHGAKENFKATQLAPTLPWRVWNSLFFCREYRKLTPPDHCIFLLF